VKQNILPLPLSYVLSLVMFVLNNLGNFKTTLLLPDFNTRSKYQLHFPTVKLTSVKQGITYSAIKIINHLPY
jgi:hypothetical protein